MKCRDYKVFGGPRGTEKLREASRKKKNYFHQSEGGAPEGLISSLVAMSPGFDRIRPHGVCFFVCLSVCPAGGSRVGRQRHEK